MANQDFQVLLMGIIFTVGGIFFRKMPLSLLKGYEYIKNDQKAMKRTKIFYRTMGYIFQTAGIFIVMFGVLSILGELL